MRERINGRLRKSDHGRSGLRRRPSHATLAWSPGREETLANRGMRTSALCGARRGGLLALSLLCSVMASLASAQDQAATAPPGSGPAKPDSRTQLPQFLWDAYLGLNIGYLSNPFSTEQLQPGFRTGSVTVPHAAFGIALFGYRFDHRFAAQITYLRPVKFVRYDNINGQRSSNTVWMAYGALTVKSRIPISRVASAYAEAGVGVSNRRGFQINGVQVVSNSFARTFVVGGGVDYRLSRSWDLVAGALYARGHSRTRQPRALFVSGGVRYNLQMVPPEQVAANAAAGFAFPEHLLLIGYSTPLLRYGANRLLSRQVPIFWGGKINVPNRRRHPLPAQRVSHTEAVRARSWREPVALQERREPRHVHRGVALPTAAVHARAHVARRPVCDLLRGRADLHLTQSHRRSGDRTPSLHISGWSRPWRLSRARQTRPGRGQAGPLLEWQPCGRQSRHCGADCVRARLRVLSWAITSARAVSGAEKIRRLASRQSSARCAVRCMRCQAGSCSILCRAFSAALTTLWRVRPNGPVSAAPGSNDAIRRSASAARVSLNSPSCQRTDQVQPKETHCTLMPLQRASATASTQGVDDPSRPPSLVWAVCTQPGRRVRIRRIARARESKELPATSICKHSIDDHRFAGLRIRLAVKHPAAADLPNHHVNSRWRVRS